MKVVEEPSEGPETEDGEPAEDGDVTPVTEPSDGQSDETKEDGAPVEDESTDETESDDVSDSNLEEDEAEVPDSAQNQIKAMETAEDVTITLKQPVTGSNGEVKYEDLKNAVISYSDNCADNKTNAVNKDAEYIKFKVTPVDGKKVTEVAYALATQTDEFGTPASLASNPTANQEFTISESVSALAAAKLRIMIVVTTADVDYTVNITKSTGASSAAQISFVKTSNVYETETFSTAAATNEASTVKYNGSLSFAVKGLGLDAKKVIVTANKSGGIADDAITLSGSVYANGTPNDAIDDVLEYTLRASEVKKLNKKADDTIVVTISKPGEKSLTLKDASFTGFDVDATHLVVAENTVTALELGAGYANLNISTDASYTVDKKIAFTTTLQTTYEDDYKIIKPVAQWAEASDAATKKDLPVTSEKKGDDTYWAINLSSVTADGYLWITIKAEPDESKPGVKTISFAGSNVKAAIDPDADGEGSITVANNLVGKSTKTTADEYAFVVEPESGYVITKIETTINKVYASGTPATATETIMINENGEKYTEEDDGLYDAFVDKKGFKLPLLGKDKLEDGTYRSWTAKTISVNITTEEQKTDVNIPVKFVVDNGYNNTDKGVYGYTVNTADGLVTTSATVDPDNGYLVKKGASSLEFTVTGVGEVAPVIKINNAAYTGKAVSGSTYKIPVGKLDASKTSLNPNVILIERQSKTVTVKYAEAGSVTASVKDAAAASTELLGAETGGGPYTRTATVNADAMTVIEISNAAGKKADISSVTYWFGTNGTKQTAEKNGNTYKIETKLKDNLTVEVKKSEDKQLKVAYSDGGTVEKNEAGVYLVEKYEKTVRAEIFGGETALVLFSAVVKDGDKNAKTKAAIDTINQKYVEIVVDKTERGKDLKVEIVTLEDRTPVEFVLRADKAVEAISYGGISDGKVSLPVDSEVKAKIDLPDGIKAQNLNVLLLAGNADVPASNLSSTMSAAASVDGVEGRYIDDTNVKVTLYDDGSLSINAKANSAGAAVADAAKIVLYDNRATGDNCVALKGSEVKIDIEQATVKANALSAPVVSTTAKEIILNVTLPDGVVTPKTGKLYYKVSVTAPTSGYDTKEVNGKTYTGIESAVTTWAASYPRYYFVDDVKTAGGSITLNPFTGVAPVGGVAFPGMALDGFEVEVSLAQTYEASPPSVSDGNTIVGEGMKAAAALQAPSYANTETGKLNLKKENYGTLYTGNTAWVAVATPDFGKSAAAYTAVETVMVDMKTGKTYSTWNGMQSRYNPATGKVEVKFDSKTNSYYIDNAAGNNKDVGVKVVAKTEDTGYALAGTMKLTVANGIESIAASAQPRVLKNDKAASFKVNVAFNNEGTDKKYAPKSKNVTYTIVGSTTTTDGHSVNLAPAPAKIAAAVTSKNGTSPTINIDKNYAVTGTEAENTFKILVTAKDYAGNETYGLTPDILITSESAPLGELVVMKKGTNWNDATLVSGAAEATKESGEFKAVVLMPGVGKDRATYNLNDSSIVVPANYVNFAPAKGNISINANGFITIKKLGKANLSATDKSNKKNASKCAVEFVEKNTTMALRLTQLKDSTLETPGKVSYDRSFTFSGRNTTFFGVDIVDDKDKSDIKLSNAKVKFGKNLKNVTPKNNSTYQYVIAMTGADAVITLQPKSGAAADYTLKNEAYAKDKKAPKVALENKAQKFTQGSLSDATYVLTSAVKGEKFDGLYVMLSVDNTKKNPADVKDNWDNVGGNSAFTVGGVEYTDRAIAIREGGKFDLKFAPYFASSYNLLVAVGELKDGVFTQTYPDARLVLKAGKKGSVKIKATGNYTLNPYVNSKVAISYNGNVKKAQFTNSDGTIDTTKNYAMNAIIGNKENKFRDYFIAQEDADGNIATIGLRDDITSEQLNALLANPKSEDLTGYISINNGDSYVDVKIKITLKAETKGLKAVCDTVLEGDQVVADVRLLNGKEAVKVTDYTIVSAEGGITRAQNRADYLTNKKVDGAGAVVSGDIRLKADKLAAGKYKVSLKVTPENTPAINRSEDTRKTYEVPVDLIITVAKKDTKNKIVLGKGDNVWVITKGDFVGPQGVENEPEDGSWQKAISYRFKNRLSIADDTKISVESDPKVPYISFVSDNYKVDSAAQKLTVVVDKKKLASAIDGKKLKWGGKVTATATFKYGTSGIKEDTVKLTITLPAQPAAELSDNKVFKDAETNIENMVATMYEHYTNATGYDATDAAANSIKSEAIAKRIAERLYEVADGATVTVNVTYTKPVTALADSYTATVSTKSKANFYEHTFGARTEKTVDNVKNAIKGFTNTTGSTVDGVVYDMVDWVFTGKVTAAMAGGADKQAALVAELNKLLAAEVTKDTTDAQYAAFIRKVLVKTGQITSNINISVETLENGRTAPTSDAAGYYNVKVTVTDRNVAPSLGGHSDELKLRVTFGQLEGTSTALAALAESADPTDRSMFHADNSAKVAAAAWKAVATPGMKYNDQKFFDELEKQLVAKANELILKGAAGTTGNEALKATGILNGTLQVTVNTTKDDEDEGKLTTLAYTMLLSDTSDGKAVEKRINVSFTTPTLAPEFQTMSQLTEKLTAGNLTVKTVSEKTAAFAEIEKTIKEKLCTNPALDLTDLKVEDAATPKFTAPTAKYDGLVSVKITCTGMTETTVNNIVILKGENDFTGEGADDDAKALSKELKRIEAALKAELNSETLEKMYVDMQKEYAKDTSANAASDPSVAANVEKKITELADAIVGDTGYYKVDTETVADNAVDDIVQGTSGTQSDLAAPTDSVVVMLPEFKINLIPTDAGDTLSAANATVQIPNIKISALDEFQSWEKASGIFVNNMVKNLTGANALVIDYVEIGNLTAPAADSPAGTAYTIGASANFQEIANPVVTALKKASSKEITNPLFSIKIAKEQTGDNATTCKTHATYQYAIDNLKVTLDDATTGADHTDDDPQAEGHISVNVKKIVNSEDAVTEIAFKTVGTNTNATAIANASTPASKLAFVVSAGSPSTIAITAEATMSKSAKRQNAEFDWKVDNGEDNDAAGTAVAGVTISNGTITIDKTVCGNESHKQWLRVTATAKTKGFGGTVMKKSIYLELTFKPAVTITMDSANPKEIEIGSDGKNTTGKKFKAALTGTNVRADDAETVLKWTLYAPDGTTAVGNTVATLTYGSSGADKSEVTVTFTGDASAYANKQLTLKAEIDGTTNQSMYTNGTTAAATCKFTVVQDTSTAAANRKITLTSATGVDSIADVTGGAKKIVVTGTNVRIPLSVNDAKYGSRIWTYALAAVETTPAMAALDAGKYETAAQTVGSTDEDTKPIRIETSSDGKNSWLVITDVPGGLADGTTDVPAKAVKITATTTAGDEGAAVTASDLNVILVVKKSIDTMKLYKVTESAGSGSEEGDDESGDNTRMSRALVKEDNGEDVIAIKQSDGPIDFVAMLEGAHLTDEEKNGQIDAISYKITNKSQGVKASINTANHKATLTIAEGGSTGSVTVTATYKSGTGENAVTMTATRIIKVTEP